MIINGIKPYLLASLRHSGFAKAQSGRSPEISGRRRIKPERYVHSCMPFACPTIMVSGMNQYNFHKIGIILLDNTFKLL
jgi:hypothetical protein